MFVQVAVVLTGVKATILFFDKGEWGCLRGVRRVDLSTVEVFLEEVFSSFVFVRRERVNFPDRGSDRFVKVDFMVIGSSEFGFAWVSHFHQHVPIGSGKRWLFHTSYQWWRG